MRLIHCADVHLDAKMTANLSKDKARERKKELLLTFQRMVSFAAAHQVDAILLAGDLFDTRNISATARHAVWDAVCQNPQIDFFYLKGNHDTDAFLSEREELPDNFKTFGTDWTSHVLTTAKNGRRLVVSGLELTKENAGSAYHTLVLQPGDFNIVMLHGQQAKSGSKDKAEVIRLRELKNKGIDYLALGHVHAYQQEALDGRGLWCYPGCLEGRGFDECGAHGFVLLDVDEERGTFSHQFIPFATRRLFAVPVDVADGEKPSEILENITHTLKDEAVCGGACPTEEDLLKIVLTGEVDVEYTIDTEFLRKSLEPMFYYVKISDETRMRIDAERFCLDVSLKGEFVRTVMAQEELSEEEKAAIIRYGLRAIAGEEVLGCV